MKEGVGRLTEDKTAATYRRPFTLSRSFYSLSTRLEADGVATSPSSLDICTKFSPRHSG